VIDAFQWLINLMQTDLALLVGGILALVALVEFLVVFKRWIT
jgi:hypothetical protein